MLDSGISPDLTEFSGRIASFKSYTSTPNNSANDTTGHGSTITQVMAGSKTDAFVGGVAPGAELHIAQVCDASDSCFAYQAAYSDLAAQGVKLFNQSFGFSLATPSDTVAQQFADEFQSMVDTGSLFVWSAGNDGSSKLNFAGAVPVYRPDLQRGWLVVANGVVDSEGKVTGLDASSAQCGIAADWCLVAPGTAKTEPVAGTAFNTGFSDGTSNSAAIVTGIAAQVSQAFPWMTGSNIQQTLLTTATSIGDKTLYGWGVVNADKAVDGPAGFEWGNFNADVTGGSYTFANDIGGSGGVVKDGGGTLKLAGTDTYAGGTTINAGTLLVDGSVTGSVVVGGGGTLGGAGSVNAGSNKVLNSGTVTTGYGALKINGDYSVVNSLAITSIQIGKPLAVTGNASLNNSVLNILAPAATYTVNSTETLLSAGSLSGQFGTKTYGPSVFYTADLHYSATSVTADLARTSVSQSVPMANPAMASTANGIESAMQQADKWSQSDYDAHAPFLNKAASFLSAKTQAEAQASIQSLDGEIYATSGAIEAQQSRLVDDAIAVRQGAANPSDAGALWAQSLSANGSLFAPGFSSARYHANGVLLGGEAPLSENITGGIALGRHYMDAGLAGLSGRVKGKEDTAALYARFAMGEGAYLAGRASWSHERMTVTRSALIGGVIEPLASERTDGIGRASIEVGKAFSISGSSSVIPYLAVSALRINQAAFAESGADGFGLVSDSHRQSATQADLGVRVAHGFDWAGGHSLLTGYAAYRRVLTGANLDFTAALSGAPDATFRVMGQGMAIHTGQIGLNLATQINQDWDWFVNADAQAARGHAHGLSANAGVRFHF